MELPSKYSDSWLPSKYSDTGNNYFMQNDPNENIQCVYYHSIVKTKHSVCLFLLSILHKPCHTVRIQASFINGIKSISWRAKAAAKSLYTCIFNYLSKYSIRFLFHFGESLPTGEDALFVYCMYWAAVRFFCVSAIQYLRQRK